MTLFILFFGSDELEPELRAQTSHYCFQNPINYILSTNQLA